MNNEQLALYYLGVKLLVVLYFSLGLFLKHAYLVNPYTRYAVVFFLLTYVVLNLLLFIKGGNFFRKPFSRYLDYLLVLLTVVLSLNLYGLIPVGFILGLYSVIYIREIILLFLTNIAIILIKYGLFKIFPLNDTIFFFLYLLGVTLVSAKLNILALLKERKKMFEKLRTEIRKRDIEAAYFAEKVKLYEEILGIIDKIVTKSRYEDFVETLKNLLMAEDIKVFKSRGLPLLVIREKYITVKVGNIVFAVKPLKGYMLNDKHYREKVAILAKVLKPYVESFLANNR